MIKCAWSIKIILGGNIMPVLIVRGIPSAVESDRLNNLAYELASITGICLTIDPEGVSVFFPSDLLQRGLGEELVCIVDGLFENPDRTNSVRQRLAEAIARALRAFAQDCLPKCEKVEAILNRFNQSCDGFAVFDPRKSGND